MKNRIEIKAEAKQIIQNARISPLLVSGILVLTTFLLNRADPAWAYINYLSDEFDRMLEQGANYVPVPMEPLSPWAVFLSILIFLVSAVLTAGFISYCMGIRQGREMGLSSLLDGLSIAGKVIWCNILVGIRVALWSMLFVIPGIVASFRYRFALYNIIHDPSLTASQAISLSCRQTHGMKLDLLVLDISFLGWHILSLMTLGLLNIWVLPYVSLCNLGYFENALHRANAETTPPSSDSM